MKNPKTYFSLTLLISVLFGILLPLALGIKDPTLIAISFCFIWFIYAVMILIIVFLVEGRLSKKKFGADDKNDSFPLRDIQELQALYKITIKKDNEAQKKLWS